MNVEFITYGDAHSVENLTSFSAQRIFRLITCSNHKDFEFVELRSIRKKDDIISDVIVVDCLNDQVPTRNIVGIKNKERIALVFPSDESLMPSVRALRKNFPLTPHQNQVPYEEPASLCLYFEPWVAVQRTWTPHKHLHRVLWWLSETAKGSLHRDDQPVEQIYFDSPITLVLPPDFSALCQKVDLTLTMTPVEYGEDKSNFTTLISEFVPESEAYKNSWPSYVPIVIELPAIVHSGIERFPDTLGILHDQLDARGISIFQILCEEIKNLMPSDGITHNPKRHTLLILNLPIKRTESSPIERNDIKAFMMLTDFTVLGDKLGVLSGCTGKYHIVHLVGDEQNEQPKLWRELPVLPVKIKQQVTKSFSRKASGVTEDTADFHAVLAGVGALGSVLADLWTRESWGKWVIVDDDFVEPHNIIRHITKNFQIGTYKAEAVKVILEHNFFPGYSHLEAVSDSILSQKTKIQSTIASADFLVDATTTLHVPRELSQNTKTPRSASVFLTPSGFSSVLLVEDDKRIIRLESLESQYYRAIINSDWGSEHLGGHKGQLWVGAGCRDISAIISFEMIQLHAAILSRRIRAARDQMESCIHVWNSDSLNGSVAAYTVPVFSSISSKQGLWKVLWDIGTKNKLEEYRSEYLPNETGGVIIGYIDQKIQTIFVVDVLSSPPDSEEKPSEFTRGISGLDDKLDDIAKRTANIVGYLGEWHSHPSSCSAQPSQLDCQLIKTLSETLSQDGQPALMMIVGSNEITITVKES